MKLGVVDNPGHIVLGADPALPLQKGHSPQFTAHISCGQMAAWIKISLGMELGLGPDDFVLDGNPLLLPKRGQSPQLSAHVYCAKRLDGCSWYLAWWYASAQGTLC